jgi:hypothetical protein
MVIKPVSTQTKIIHPALPTFLAISAVTIKIPEPIIEPATNIVASRRPRLGLNSLFSDIQLVLKKIPIQRNRD